VRFLWIKVRYFGAGNGYVSNDIHLVSSNSLSRTHSGSMKQHSFTESLILAQDERWRRA
jgi:hypothetical protein